ncbi:type II toxin-antitoxin system Phd/YefM family antitoxin [candidate division KSB1 bacterium]|nr:type II toxin-antitoxin system Phd/YefM family antitoxin [candidate division KSB1 bacterium]
MIEEITITDAQKQLSELVARTFSSGARFILKKRIKPIAAIVSLNDLDLIKARDQMKAEDTLVTAAGAWSEFESLEQIVQLIYQNRLSNSDREMQFK